jgi:hypothetical protein
MDAQLRDTLAAPSTSREGAMARNGRKAEVTDVREVGKIVRSETRDWRFDVPTEPRSEGKQVGRRLVERMRRDLGLSERKDR